MPISARKAARSVGAGPIKSVAGRALVKATLSLADARSYRDDASRDYLRGIGFQVKRDPVYPDLVFGLPEAMLSHSRAKLAYPGSKATTRACECFAATSANVPTFAPTS